LTRKRYSVFSIPRLYSSMKKTKRNAWTLLFAVLLFVSLVTNGFGATNFSSMVGWTLATTIPTQVDQYYFAFVDMTTTSGYLMGSGVGDNQGSDYLTMYFRAMDVSSLDPAMVWMLEDMADVSYPDDATMQQALRQCFAVRNLGDSRYVFETDASTASTYRQSGHTSPTVTSAVSFTYNADGEYWLLGNAYHNIVKGKDLYLGSWNDKAKDAEVAMNKDRVRNGQLYAKCGRYQLYYIARQDYMAQLDKEKPFAVIANPGFDSNSDFGWTWDNKGSSAVKGTTSNYLVTSYGTGFALHQQLYGLVNGKYRLKVRAFSRPNTNQSTWDAVQKGNEVENVAYIYANDKKQRTKLITDEWQTTKPASGTWTEVATDHFIPDNSAAFSLAFGSMAMYDNELEVTVIDGTLCIGFCNPTTSTTAYSGVDDFRLYYIGGAELDEMKQDALKTLDDYASLNTTHDDAFAQTIQTAIDKINGATTAEEISEAVNDVRNAYNELQEQLRLEKEKQEQLIRSLDTMAKVASQAIDHSTFDAVLKDAREKLSGTENKDSIKAIVGEVKAAFAQLLETYATNTKQGRFDLTPMLLNTTFNTDISGWDIEGDGTQIKWKDSKNVEVYNVNNAVSLGQTLYDMPAGPYTMAVQAYYRTCGVAVDADQYEKGQYTGGCTMLLGDQKQTIMNINEYARYTPSNSSDVGGAFNKTIPMLMNGAASAFEQGRYWNTVSTALTQTTDLTLKLCYDANTRSTDWFAFDNVRLYYGEGATINLQSSDASLPVDCKVNDANVTLKRTLKADKWQGFCVPFSITDSTQLSLLGDIARIVYAKGNKLILQDGLTHIEAGQPYMIKPTSEVQTMTFEHVNYDPATSDKTPVVWQDATMQEGTYKGYTVRVGDKNVALYSAEMIDWDNVDMTINLENPNIRRYMKEVTYNLSSTSKVSNYTSVPVGRPDQPNTVYIPVRVSEEEQTLTLTLQDEEVMQLSVPAGTDHIELGTLIPQRTYYYTLSQGGVVSSKGCIHTEGTVRMIKANSVSNIRDFGGRVTTSGKKVRYGMIYRGGQLNGKNFSHQSTPEAQHILRDIVGIRAELDLRDNIADGIQANGENQRSELGSTVTYLHNNHVGNATPVLYNDEMMSWATDLKYIFKNVAEGKPVYFHCVWGADRTGVLACLVNGLLGVKVNDIIKDYEMTSFSWAGKRELDGVTGKIEYIKTMEGNTLQEQFENYCVDKLKLNIEDIHAFQQNMLEDNVSVNIESVLPADAPNRISCNAIYTLEGKLLGNYSSASHLPKGIYLVGGRKYCVR